MPVMLAGSFGTEVYLGTVDSAAEEFNMAELEVLINADEELIEKELSPAVAEEETGCSIF